MLIIVIKPVTELYETVMISITEQVMHCIDREVVNSGAFYDMSIHTVML